MRLENGYLVKQIENKYVIIPAGQNVINGEKTVFINESTYFILKLLENEMAEEELIDSIRREYEVSREQILSSVDNLIHAGYIIHK